MIRSEIVRTLVDMEADDDDVTFAGEHATRSELRRASQILDARIASEEQHLADVQAALDALWHLRRRSLGPVDED